MWLWPLWCAFLWHVAGHQGIPQDELGGIGGDGWVELPKVVDPTCSCQPSSSASDGELLQLSQWNCLRIHQAGVDYATLAANYGQNVNQDPGCPNLLKVNDCNTGMESGDFYVLISTHPWGLEGTAPSRHCHVRPSKEGDGPQGRRTKRLLRLGGCLNAAAWMLQRAGPPLLHQSHRLQAGPCISAGTGTAASIAGSGAAQVWGLLLCTESDAGEGFSPSWRGWGAGGLSSQSRPPSLWVGPGARSNLGKVFPAQFETGKGVEGAFSTLLRGHAGGLWFSEGLGEEPIWTLHFALALPCVSCVWPGEAKATTGLRRNCASGTCPKRVSQHKLWWLWLALCRSRNQKSRQPSQMTDVWGGYERNGGNAFAVPEPSRKH